MKIVHISHTPVAGQPLIVVNALNRHTNYQARLITYDIAAYGLRTFDYDIDWRSSREVALEVLESADIIHLHQYWDLVENEFGIDFTQYARRGARLIRQFHSVPALLASGDKALARNIVAPDIPLLVLSHHQERFYPRARVVPLMVPVMDEHYSPAKLPPAYEEKSILFSPTNFGSTIESRWDTKGTPETLALLNACAEAVPGVSVNFLHDQPHRALQGQRRNSYLVVDDIVTGTYHTTSLESLSMGIPVLALLDDRVADNVRSISGCLEPLPWVDFPLHEARGALIELLTDEELRNELGQYSRAWMVKYWNDKALIQIYVDAYIDLVSNPDAFDSLRFDPGNKLSIWFSKKSADLRWEGRFILRHWAQLERECKGRLVLYGHSEFGGWLIDLLTRNGFRLPDIILEYSEVLPNEGLAVLDEVAPPPLTRLDCIVLAENRPWKVNIMRAQLESHNVPARLVSLCDGDEALTAYGEATPTPIWERID